MPKTTTIKLDDGSVIEYTARRRKYRFNCCSCGKRLADAPSLWGYCSKACERTGGNGGDDGSQMSNEDTEEYLRLSKERDEAPQYLKDEYTAKMDALQPEPQAAKGPEPGPRPEKTSIDFWRNPVNREFEKFRVLMSKALDAGKRLGLVLLDAKAHMDSEDSWKELCDSVPGKTAAGAIAVAHGAPKGFMTLVRRLFK